MKYLITGATGFAGPHLAQLLHDKGHKVYGLIRGSNGMETDILDVVSQECFDNITFLYGNLEDQAAITKLFTEHQFDGVFHLAAQSHPPTSLTHPVDTFRTNVMGSIHLIDAIQQHQPECTIMFCSTSEVYGNLGQGGQLLKETDLLAPSNPYGVSKAAIDLYMQERMTNKKIKGFITRAFSHTGPRRGKNFSISSDAYQVAKIAAGLQEPEILVGNLDTVRVVMDVRDTVNAYYQLMLCEESEGEVFNVCGDTPYKMAHFTEELISLSGLMVPVKRTVSPKLCRPIDIYYQHGDTTKLRALTGWEPKYELEHTLKDLLEYWTKKIS